MQDCSQGLTAEKVGAAYRRRSEVFAGRTATCAKWVSWIQRGNLTALAFAALALLQATSGVTGAGRWFVVALVVLGTAAAGMLVQRWLQYRQREYELFHLSNQHALAGMERRWDDVPVARTMIPEHDAAQANDLDLFGRASLFHLVCRARTVAGIDTLRDWLLAPAEPNEIFQRQQAVNELRAEMAFRQEIEVGCAMLRRDEQSFLQWVEGEPWLARRKWTARLLFLESTVPALALLGASLGIVSIGVGVGTMCAACLVNLFIITTFVGGPVHDVFRRASPREGFAWDCLRLFQLVARLPGTSGRLTEFRRLAADYRTGAIRGFRSLVPITVFGYGHRDPLKTAMYLPLQVFLLWDLYLLVILERWQRRWSSHCREWFEMLGQVEAVSSLASVAQENPDWCFPDVDAEHAKGVNAKELGHPLLGREKCVCSDVTLGPPGKFLLVSGSNMSGKSTLLRAIGLNLILAQAGGPVCASKWTMSPAVLATVIRIDDCLTDGVSLFLAGLYRIKEVVARAKEMTDRSHRTLIYLLDEPLRGTNARERHIATQRVLDLLVKHDAVGAVSSHDVELAQEEALADACIAVHFQETIDTSRRPIKIIFDYRLRPGVATSTNALELVELVGLE